MIAAYVFKKNILIDLIAYDMTFSITSQSALSGAVCSLPLSVEAVGVVPGMEAWRATRYNCSA